MESEAIEEEPVLAVNTPDPIQCPICITIIDELYSQECRTCHFDLTEKNELAIQRKRIAWQEKISFEHKKQTEIAHKLKYEREQEEKNCAKKSVPNWNPNYAKS